MQEVHKVLCISLFLSSPLGPSLDGFPGGCCPGGLPPLARQRLAVYKDVAEEQNTGDKPFEDLQSVIQRSFPGLQSCKKGQKYPLIKTATRFQSAPDYSRSDATDVRVILRGEQPFLQFASFVYEQDKAGEALSLDEMLVLNTLFFERRIDAERARKLRDSGGLEQVGRDRGACYRFRNAQENAQT